MGSFMRMDKKVTFLIWNLKQDVEEGLWYNVFKSYEYKHHSLTIIIVGLQEAF